MLTILLPLAIVLITLYHHFKRASSNGSHLLPLPPSPRRLPWIGNLHNLGSLPYQSLCDLSRIHGPIMLLRLGYVPTLVVSSPEAAKEVMKTQDLVFASRPPMAMARELFYEARDVIFGPYGEEWRQAKKICVVHALSSKRVQSYTKVREDEVAIMLQKIRNQSELGPLDLSTILNNFVYTVVARIVLGRAYVNQQDSRGSNEFCSLIEEMSTLLGLFPVEDFFPRLGWLSSRLGGTASRARTCFRSIDKFLDRVLDDHRRGEHRNMRADGTDQEDMVDMLLSMQQDRDHEGGGISLSEDNFIKSIILDLVSAGTDTTFITLEWTMSELIRNPQLLARAKMEIDRSVSGETKSFISEEEASSMEYIEAIGKESLRLHPPGPLVLPREAATEAAVLGYRIPSRARVIVNAWAMGRDARYWEDPMEFRPERFLDSKVDYRGQDFHFLPFGSGRRMCPGISLATATARVALANLINMFDWEVAGGDQLDMEEAPGITTRRRQPLVVVAKPRFRSSNGI